MTRLKAGAGKSGIFFPEKLFPVEGFIKVHDIPYARILVLDNGIRAVLVSLELVMVEENLLDELRNIVREKTGADKKDIWIQVTHPITTPHSPKASTGGNLEGKKEWYESAVKHAVTEAACQASKVREASLGINTGFCDINRNRDISTPKGWWIGKGGNGPSNKVITVLRAEDQQGRIIGGFVGYGIKPCAIDNAQREEKARQISADLTGFACQYVEEEWNAPILFLMGAAAEQIPAEQAWYDVYKPDGTITTIDLGVETGIRLAEKYGRRMGEAVLETAENIRCDQNPVIRHETTSFLWKTKERAELYPRKAMRYEPDGNEKEFPIEVLMFGSTALVAVKPEVCCVTEKELKECSPFAHTLLLVMVNGGMKYMPDGESYRRITWEAMNSVLMPGAAEKFVETTSKLLKEAEGKEKEKIL